MEETFILSGSLDPGDMVGTSSGSDRMYLAIVPSTQYPATMQQFLASVHQDSKSSLDKPDCIIPGLVTNSIIFC